MAASVEKKEHILQLDLIRVIAMFFVILMHTVLNFTIRPDFFATPIWFGLAPVVAFAKTGVLLFFFLSGYLVIGKQRSLQENTKKLWQRIVFPLLFFEALRLFYNWYVFSPSDLALFGITEILRLMTFPSSPLWFLEMLVFFYILNPLWQVLFIEKNKTLAQYATFLAFLFTFGTTLVSYVLDFLPVIFTTFTAWTAYLFFYLYGGLVRQKWVEQRSTFFYGTVLIICLSATVFGDYLASWARVHGGMPGIFQYTGSYLSIPVSGMAWALFHLLLSFNVSHWLRGKIGDRISAGIVWIAHLSFGVYLIHMYVVGVLVDIFRYDFNTAGLNIYIYNALNVFLVITFSIGLTWIIKSTPILRRIIGEKN